MPRRYRSTIRKRRQEELYQRIVEATVVLHAEKGVAETTYKDIAQKADVAIPSVYKYFPDPSRLLMACTKHAAALAPVQSEEALTAYPTLKKRVDALVDMRCQGHAYFHPWLKWGGERVIPEIRSLLEEDARRTERLIMIALSPAYGAKRIPKEIMGLVLVLLSYHTWASLRFDRGCTQQETVNWLARAICKLGEG